MGIGWVRSGGSFQNSEKLSKSEISVVLFRLTVNIFQLPVLFSDIEKISKCPRLFSSVQEFPIMLTSVQESQQLSKSVDRCP